HLGSVSSVKLDGKTLTSYISKEALDGAQRGYFVDGNTLYVKFPDSAKETVLTVEHGGMVLPEEGKGVDPEDLDDLIAVEVGTVVELEDVTRYAANTSIGLPIDTEWKGYTGTGFVKGFKCTGDYVTFDANVKTAGTYDIVLRVNCGKKNDNTDRADRTGGFYLDGGKLSELAFAITETWGDSDKNGDWRDYVIENVALSTGKHTFKIMVEGSNPGHYNLDCVRFADANAPVNGFSTIAARDADVMTNAVAEGNTVHVTADGAALGFLSVIAEGKTGFEIRLSGTTGGTLTVYETGVGDKILATVELPTDGQWHTLSVESRDTDAHPSPIYLSFTAASGESVDVTVDWFKFT
ncbi:MAG: carbohydrate-binding protein, partial [Ruminococcaceae bacterium]|nr:carbohydrate-binding protein [Oscillospiraceae bacterium]